MTPTSDERREVAARLRETKRKCEQRGYPWLTDDLILAIGYERDYEADDGIFDRLIDLIDPTCHPVPSDGGFFTCSECGERIGAVLPTLGTVLMHHCSHCGARVTDGGED